MRLQKKVNFGLSIMSCLKSLTEMQKLLVLQKKSTVSSTEKQVKAPEALREINERQLMHEISEN